MSDALNGESREPAPVSDIEQLVEKAVGDIIRDLPEPVCEYGDTADLQLEMRDGVSVKTHLYFPRGEGPWPVIAMRNPYVEGIDIGSRMYRLFTRYGYALVYQECRGRGASGGKWEPFVHEREDGLDTLGWIALQPWCDGNIGLYGGSYLTCAQLTMAGALPPQVKTMFLMVYGPDQYAINYMNGMFKHEVFTTWLMTNAGVPAKEAPDEANRRALRIRPHIGIDRELFGGEIEWYRKWVSRTAPGDPLWTEGVWGRLKEAPAKIGIPVHMIAGWYDIALEPMISMYAQLKDEVRRRSRFVVGPWDHAMIASGDLACPDNRIMEAGPMRPAIEWFDHVLKGKPYGERIGVMKSYTLGAGGWTDKESWPPASEPARLYLRGEEGLTYPGGGLSAELPATRSSVSFVYDPANPVPTRGGGVVLPQAVPSGEKPVPGSVKQPEPAFHPEVISFLSAPLSDGMLVEGSVKAKLAVRSDAEDTSFAVKLMAVFPDGNAYNMVDGITSLAYRNGAQQPVAYRPGDLVDVEIELWPISWRIQAGSRLRLDICSSNFPAYHLHPNKAGIWSEEPAEAFVKASQTVFFGGDCQSCIELPVIP